MGFCEKLKLQCKDLRGYCRCSIQVLFRCMALGVLILATSVQALAIGYNTNWDVYNAIPGTGGVYTDAVSAHQTLYQLFVDSDLPKAHFVPPAYPYTAESRNTGILRTIQSLFYKIC